MKKLVVIIIPLFLLMLSCSTIERMDITKLTFLSIDYNGGHTTNYVFDFQNNEYKRYSYLPGFDNEPVLRNEMSFTDEEELVFLKGINKCGLLGIKKEYKKDGIVDGGGWNLTIDFEDGTSFTSKGSNDGPKNVFNQCAYYFYDLCGSGVVGMIPAAYTNPANISYTFHYQPDAMTNVSSNGLARVQLGNYKWNKKSSLDNDYYAINLESKEYNEFNDAYTYKLVLYTANYYYAVKFDKIEVFEFDFTPELTNNKIIYSGGWFKQIEMDISFNKIYMYRLSYSSGDYSEFTFNTYINTD